MSTTIGSSDVATILGLSPWGDPYDTWSRVRGDVGYATRDTAAQLRGRVLESAWLSYYALDRAVLVTPGPAIDAAPVAGPEPWMHTRPDGYAQAPGDGAPWLLEVKTARNLDPVYGWGPDDTDQIPLHYLVQCAWHMACTDLDRCDLVAFGTWRDDLRVYRIERDHKIESSLIAKCREWYQRHIVEGHPPAIGDPAAAKRALARAYPTRAEERPSLTATQAQLRQAAALRHAKTQRDGWAKQAAALEAELCLAMGDHGVLETSGGAKVATWRDRKATQRIDAKRLRANHPEIADLYTSTSPAGRTFRLATEKP